MKLPDCEIHEFTSGRDLLSFYVKGMYEVIILDVEMPDLTGLQTAERIRHNISVMQKNSSTEFSADIRQHLYERRDFFDRQDKYQF